MICEYCNQEVKGGVVTCSGNTRVEYEDGLILPSISYCGDAVGPEEPCPDCGVMPGGNHHPGCDIERCPRCKGQLIGCSCGVAFRSAA